MFACPCWSAAWLGAPIVLRVCWQCHVSRGHSPDGVLLLCRLLLVWCHRVQVSCFSYGPVSIRIREGALGDGLGAQVWAVAHILCRWVGGWVELLGAIM
jgi:hypothetical protein